MKLVDGLWLPDGEKHLLNKNVANYQGDKRDEAMRWVRQWRNAVDVGAHCGLWSVHLAKRFRQVYAFEPVAEHRACFEKNVGKGARLYDCALGRAEGVVGIRTDPESSASACVDGAGAVTMDRLDNFGLPDVDFLKVDCCGYELPVLQGAADLLRSCKPCVSVEQKPGYPERFGFAARRAVDFLEDLGAVLRAEKAGVYVMSWD